MRRDLPPGHREGAGSSFSQKDALALSLPPSAPPPPLLLCKRQGWSRAGRWRSPPCKRAAGSRPLRAGHSSPCPQAPPLWAGLGRGLAIGGRPYMGAGRGWSPLLLVAFAAKMQQKCVKRFYAIQSHHMQFKTNLLYKNLSSDTAVGKPQWIRMEKMKEVKRPPL
ncbi:hypothetical protein B296_00036450 [Ensete ventricosum]|uniref:Uncharacterized protein n=1 Tax=Ensete ventricosum TaxID=4639 RepID=A0A426Z1Y1_ENSVE|nr:hypothetical protein B296_00036450 [Ensete ventricosum]